jgi:hypothetical protein
MNNPEVSMSAQKLHIYLTEDETITELKKSGNIVLQDFLPNSNIVDIKMNGVLVSIIFAQTHNGEIILFHPEQDLTKQYRFNINNSSIDYDYSKLIDQLIKIYANIIPSWIWSSKFQYWSPGLQLKSNNY